MSNLLNGIQNQSPSVKPQAVNQAAAPAEAHSQFANALKSAIDNVNEAQAASDKKTEAMAKGQSDNLHDVMISAQKASITLETSVQVQRKVIDAYNEIMRMQI